MKQLLIDTMFFEPLPGLMVESKTNGRLLVSGILQRAEAKNQNGRRYPKKILMREAKKYLETCIKENRALGELDHPDSSVVSLKNVSHIVRSLHWKGNDLIGQVEVLPTPSGNILKSLFETKVQLGISSRGMGSVKELSENEVEVQDDFELICWDFVSNPSTHGAFMFQESIQKDGTLLRESVEFNGMRSGENTELLDRIHENITAIICEIGDVCECVVDA
jgi:hypothetical protein